MYSTSARDNSITLWCDARIEPSSDGSSKKKRSCRDDGREEPTSKQARRERDIDDIFETLREKHSVDDYSDPQLRLWARMYANGSHSSNKSLTEALAGAATAVTKILAPRSPSKVPHRKPDGISPSSKANLSGQYLQQLRTLQQLRDDKTLTEEEFQEQKFMLLKNIKGLNNS